MARFWPFRVTGYIYARNADAQQIGCIRYSLIWVEFSCLKRYLFSLLFQYIRGSMPSELRWIMFEGIEPSFFEESVPGLK